MANSIEQKNSASKISTFRIVFILFIIAGVFLFDYFVKNKKPATQVLGEEAKSEKNKEPIVDDIKKQAEETANQAVKSLGEVVDSVLNDATKYLNITASKSAETVKDYVFDNTVGTLLKQIDKLPDKQKEEVKQEICK